MTDVAENRRTESRETPPPVRPITDSARHEAAVREIEALWGAPSGSPERERLDVLATLVDAYEARRWPRISELDPVEALREHMRANSYSQGDLARVIGSQSRASEVLARKRPLSLDHVRAISRSWGLPSELLIAKYDLA